MINNKVNNNTNTNSNINFTGNIIKKALLSPTIKKLEQNLSTDSLELSTKTTVLNENKYQNLLNKTSDFLLNIVDVNARNSNKTDNSFKQIVKLAKMNSKLDQPECQVETEKLIAKANIIKNESLVLTHKNLDEVQELELLNIAMMKKNKVPKAKIMKTINDTSNSLCEKKNQTIKKLNVDSQFYKANISHLDEQMWNNRYYKGIFRSNYTILQRKLKHEAIFNYEFDLSNRINRLVLSLKESLIDETNPKKRMLIKAKLIATGKLPK